MLNTAQFPKEPPLPPIGATNTYRSPTPPSNTNTLGAPTQNLHTQRQSIISQQQLQQNAIDDSALTGKLINVEAQRIMSVLQEAQRKVMVIGILPDEVDRRVSTVFAADTVAYIGEYKLLEAKYRSLVESRAPEAEIKETAKQLRISTRAVCRHFLQNPPLIAKLRYLKSTKPSNLVQFESLLQEVKVLVYERLKTSVEEEKLKQDQLSVIIAKEQKTSNEVRLLKEELEKAKKERSTEVSKRNEVIRRLKEELRDIKQQAEDTTRRLESRSKQKEDQELQQARDKETQMRNDIIKLTEELQDMVRKNREEEALLRKKKFKVESEVENWIHKYDQDMDEKQNELEDITTIYTEEKGQLDELQSRFNDLQKEYDKIMAERAQKEEERLKEANRQKHLNHCATIIQALFRGFLARLQLKRKASGGKASGKGKAKGGKKKK